MPDHQFALGAHLLFWVFPLCLTVLALILHFARGDDV